MALSAAQLADLGQKIATAQSQAAQLEADIAKATLAKIDTTEARARLTSLQNQIRLLNLHYFNKS